MKKSGSNRYFSAIVWLIIIALVFGGMYLYEQKPAPAKIDTSEGIALLKEDKVKEVSISEFPEQKVELKLKEKYLPKSKDDSKVTKDSDDVFFFYVGPQINDIWEIVKEKGLDDGYDAKIVKSSAFDTFINVFLPLILLGLLFWFLMGRMSRGAGGLFGFGKAKTKNANGELPDTMFEDIAGVDEAIEELLEIRDYMASPRKFKKLGAKIPKGVLLYGPPGTGKTLLARAVAGEAAVPFFSISGSDFVEMFVGVGASRVRDLFAKAKEVAPSIVFIDEIDAVGRHRGSGMGGGHDEREQTLNQMLVEMDGFSGDTNVLMIAATNRPDILDPALLRPGRFDRQIAVEAPNLEGREAILKIHAKDKPLTPDVSLAYVAKKTPGFTGADLANVMNEAALLTARSGAQLIDARALDEAIDRVMAGPQKKSRKMNEKDLKNTAYHEAGHALVAAAMHYTDPVTKVTILPRGKALGYTSVMPTEDKYSVTRNELLDQMAYAMGGRVAEEVVFKDPSTGASNDIEKATDIAKKMVTLYGLSEKLGPVKLANTDDENAYLPKQHINSHSDKIDTLIDEEVQKLLENAHTEALHVIEENREILDNLANTLLEKEALEEDELTEIFKDVKRWGERIVWNPNSKFNF